MISLKDPVEFHDDEWPAGETPAANGSKQKIARLLSAGFYLPGEVMDK